MTAPTYDIPANAADLASEWDALDPDTAAADDSYDELDRVAAWLSTAGLTD